MTLRNPQKARLTATLLIVGVVSAATLGIVFVSVARSHRSVPAAISAPKRASGPVTSSTFGGLVSNQAAQSDVVAQDACVVGAVGRLPSANGTSVEFPPAQSLPLGAEAVSALSVDSEALEMAAEFGGVAAPTSSPLASEEVPYGTFLSQANLPANPDINVQRCIWVVTVHAPIATKPAPGGTPQVLSDYTVAFDAGTGTLVDLAEGQSFVTNANPSG